VKLRTIVAACLTAAVATAAPLASPSPASAALTCSKYISGKYAYGTCTGSGTWRVVALCHWQTKKVGPWISGSRSSNAGPCSIRATGAVIEYK
jgi:hypothetical protein